MALRNDPLLKNAMEKFVQMQIELQKIERQYKHTADRKPFIEAIVESLENNFEGKIAAAAVKLLLDGAKSAQIGELFNIYYDPFPVVCSRVSEARATSGKEAESKKPFSAAREQILISYFSLLLAKSFLEVGKNTDRLSRMFISDPRRKIEQQNGMPPFPPRLRLMMADPTQLTAEEREVRDRLLKQAIENEEAIVGEGRSAFRELLTLSPRMPLRKSDAPVEQKEKKLPSAMPRHLPGSAVAEKVSQRGGGDVAAAARKKREDQEKKDLELAKKLQEKKDENKGGSIEPDISSSAGYDSDGDNSPIDTASSDSDSGGVEWIHPSKRAAVLPPPVSSGSGASKEWKLPRETKIFFDTDGDPIYPDQETDSGDNVDYVASSILVPPRHGSVLHLDAKETNSIIAGMRLLRASEKKPFNESQVSWTKESLKEVAIEYLFVLSKAASLSANKAAKYPEHLTGFMQQDKKFGGFEFSKSERMRHIIEQIVKEKFDTVAKQILERKEGCSS